MAVTHAGQGFDRFAGRGRSLRADTFKRWWLGPRTQKGRRARELPGEDGVREEAHVSRWRHKQDGGESPGPPALKGSGGSGSLQPRGSSSLLLSGVDALSQDMQSKQARNGSNQLVWATLETTGHVKIWVSSWQAFELVDPSLLWRSEGLRG